MKIIVSFVYHGQPRRSRTFRPTSNQNVLSLLIYQKVRVTGILMPLLWRQPSPGSEWLLINVSGMAGRRQSRASTVLVNICSKFRYSSVFRLIPSLEHLSSLLVDDKCCRTDKYRGVPPAGLRSRDFLLCIIYIFGTPVVLNIDVKDFLVLLCRFAHSVVF